MSDDYQPLLWVISLHTYGDMNFPQISSLSLGYRGLEKIPLKIISANISANDPKWRLIVITTHVYNKYMVDCLSLLIGSSKDGVA